MSGIYEFGYRMPRFRADFHFLLQTGEPQPHLVDARCLDISEDGIAAQIAESLTIGAIVTLILTFPGFGNTLRIPAKVSNQHGEDHGFAFLFPSDAEREEVQRYVASLHHDPVRLRSHP